MLVPQGQETGGRVAPAVLSLEQWIATRQLAAAMVYAVGAMARYQK